MKRKKCLLISLFFVLNFFVFSYAANYSNFYTKDKNFDSRIKLTTKIIKAKNIDDIINSVTNVLKKDLNYEDKDIKIEKDYGFILASKTTISSSTKKVGNAALSVLTGVSINSAKYTMDNVNIKIKQISEESYEIKVLFNEITEHNIGTNIKFINKEKVYESFFNNLFSCMIAG